MTRDDIIQLAQQASKFQTENGLGYVEFLGHFANLVEERLRYDGIHSCHPECIRPACVAMRDAVHAEREACAKVCDEHAKRNYNWASENADIYHAQAHWAGRIADAIRARGQE